MVVFGHFTIMSALAVATFCLAPAPPHKEVTRSVPSLPNFCGWFIHDDGRTGWAFANDECKDFEWETPDDERPKLSRKKPVFTLQNVHCPLCFVFKYVWLSYFAISYR